MEINSLSMSLINSAAAAHCLVLKTGKGNGGFRRGGANMQGNGIGIEGTAGGRGKVQKSAGNSRKSEEFSGRVFSFLQHKLNIKQLRQDVEILKLPRVKQPNCRAKRKLPCTSPGPTVKGIS